MRFDFEVCFLRFFGFCDVTMKSLALIKIKKIIKKKKKIKNQKSKNHNKVSFSLSNRTSCLAKQ
jgi:hypothetical protein